MELGINSEFPTSRSHGTFVAFAASAVASSLAVEAVSACHSCFPYVVTLLLTFGINAATPIICMVPESFFIYCSSLRLNLGRLHKIKL
jgi:hypothetical protein